MNELLDHHKKQSHIIWAFLLGNQDQCLSHIYHSHILVSLHVKYEIQTLNVVSSQMKSRVKTMQIIEEKNTKRKKNLCEQQLSQLERQLMMANSNELCMCILRGSRYDIVRTLKTELFLASSCFLHGPDLRREGLHDLDNSTEYWSDIQAAISIMFCPCI